MARKSILNTYYIFDASARQVIIPGGIPREKLVLITNVTDNKVIYNFSDPELTATAYQIATDIRNITTTRVTLAYDTTSMSDTDKLQIVYDDFEETFQPAETYHDGVNKMRVSQPQAQIDTDFEYGTQDTKWETLTMINNNPFAYKSSDALAITDVQVTSNSETVTVSVNTALTPRPSAGSAIFVQDTNFAGANGVFIVDQTPTTTTFTYTAKFAWTAGPGGIWDSARTAIYTGVHYTGSDIGGSISLAAVGDGSVQVTCGNVHGLEIGNEIAIVNSSNSNVNGSWVVAKVISPKVFTYFPNDATGAGINTPTSGNQIKLYPRPQGSSIHRAYDGGVKFSTNSFSKNQQSIRQTKRYFRYQSGKGVAFSTGSILTPAIENIDRISAVNSTGFATVTVVSSVAHQVANGSVIDVRGCNDNAYNGVYYVSNVINAYKFEYKTNSGPTPSLETQNRGPSNLEATELTAGGEYSITPILSYGTNLEIGMMDQQNGIFFRYGNGKLSLVRRSSTFQLSGRVTVTQGSTSISSFTSPAGEGTKFSKQLKAGDYVVIRGSSYRVDGIISDTSIQIFPDYRGPSATNVIVTKTTETEWYQNEWNIDRCDGSGKSGYDLDFTKMQMFYMDYSWYGAGFIRWGFRGTDGNVIYAHKVPNNNFNTEAYMRSGNLPARYEVNTIPPAVYAATSISNSAGTIFTADALDKFPSSGTLRVRQTTGTSTAVTEYVNYSSKFSYKQDVLSVNGGNNTIEVATTSGLANGQPITFDRPFSNVVSNKTYYVATVFSGTTFSINTTGNATGQTLVTATGNALSPLAAVSGGYFGGLTREQAGNTTGQTLTMTSGSSSGTVASSTGIQKGQRVVGDNIPSDTSVVSISGTNIVLSKAATASNPTNVKFPAMSSGAAQTFSYLASQPIVCELLEATSVPQISHWGSSVIMEGRYDDDRAYVYTYGTKSGREVPVNSSKALMALRVSPSVDNGIPDSFGKRELVNRMQLVLRACEVNANGPFYIEVVLNPNISSSINWNNVGGTSLAQYADLTAQGSGDLSVQLVGGEVIFGFYVGNGVNTVDLGVVKEISNSILGGGFDQFAATTAPNPSGTFPDGPEVIAVTARNLGGGFGSSKRSADVRISWTEAQA